MKKDIPMTNMYSKDLEWYLKQFGVSDVSELSFSDKEKLFSEAVKDFYEKEVSVYDLSDIGGSLWESLTDEEKSSDIGDAMHMAEEVEFYLHGKNFDSLQMALGEVEKFYSKFRS